MINGRALAKVVSHALVLVVLVSPIALPSVLAGSIQSITVEWSPHFVTPYDNLDVWANVTSSIGISSVSIYYRIGAPDLKFSSIAEYTQKRMIPLYDEIWYYEFDKQPNGTVIYFFISAVDSNGAETTWPGDYSNPRQIEVRYPIKPYLNAVYIYLNQLFLSDLVQQANVTVSFSGYLPSIPDPYYRNLDVISNGPYSYDFGVTIFEDPRFFYTGRSSGLMPLTGSRDQVPYDRYTIDFNITIPYRFENLTYIAYSTPVQLFGSGDIWNSWNVPQPRVIWYSINNVTRLTVETTLSRRIADFYPPLVLMLVAFAVLGLVPLISQFYWDKRYDLFLNAIILASSAELSQTLYPAGGFLGNNVFLASFALILISAVFMMSISSMPPNIRKKSFHGFQLEFYTTIAIVSLLSTFVFFFTAFPAYAKVATPLAGGLGSIMLALYVYLPRVISGIRVRLPSSKNKNPKASRGRHTVSGSKRHSIGTFVAFGIAIGYASSLMPEQSLWVLVVGLTVCTLAYFALAFHSHNRNLWWDYGLPTLVLAVAAIAPLTSRLLSAMWAMVFVGIGCIAMILDKD